MPDLKTEQVAFANTNVDMQQKRLPRRGTAFDNDAKVGKASRRSAIWFKGL